jgi:hypothetical protein
MELWQSGHILMSVAMSNYITQSTRNKGVVLSVIPVVASHVGFSKYVTIDTG